MSSLHPTITTSFTGAVDLEGHAIPVELSFAGRSARLVVGDEEIGNWDVDEIDFTERPDGRVEIMAEDDTIVFAPNDPRAFRDHLERPARPEPDTGSDDGVGFSIPPRIGEGETLEPFDDGLPGETVEPFDDEVSGETVEPFDSDLPEGGDLFGPLAPEEPADDDRPLIEPEDRADDYFAAGIVPSSGPEPPALPIIDQSAVGNGATKVGGPPGPAEPTGVGHAEEPVEDDTTDPASEPPSTEASVSVPGATSTVSHPPSDVVPDTDERPGENPETAPSISELSIGSTNRPTEDVEETGSDDDVPEEGNSSRLSRLVRRKKTEGAANGSRFETSDDPWARSTPTQPDPAADEADDTPAGRISLAKRLAGAEPANDSENLRQWALVAAGGLVGLALLGGIAWGISSLLGGDQAVAADTAPTTVATVPAPEEPDDSPSEVATPTSPATTIPDGSSAADAQAFVSDWNGLATQYAYGLAIGDTFEVLPVSASVTGSIHVRYDTDRVLTVTAAPQSNGTDRDILVAMGMGIAWADPSVSPEGRRELLGSLGVDVDEPLVADMGGSLSRNGTAYGLEVTDGLIRFTVDPSA